MDQDLALGVGRKVLHGTQETTVSSAVAVGPVVGAPLTGEPAATGA